jgi:hypothetical protein
MTHRLVTRRSCDLARQSRAISNTYKYLKKIIIKMHYVKGPKHEIFGYRAFLQSKPVWVEVGQKNQNFNGLGLKIAILYFLP